MTTSKRQLKKIKPEGHFEGKNKVFFNEEGKTVSYDEHRRNQRLMANKESIDYNAMQLNEDRLEKNKEGDDEIERERRRDKRRRREVSKELTKRGITQ